MRKEKVSDEETSMCIFDVKIECNVRTEIQKKADMSALMDKWLTPDSSSPSMGPLLQLMEKMGGAFSNDFSVLPRFCEICLKYDLRLIKEE